MPDRNAAADILVLNFNSTTDVPAGLMAAVVTSLEMWEKPALRPQRMPDPALELQRLSAGDIERYLAIYRRLGHRWMWFSRLVMPRDELAAIIADPGVAIWCLVSDGADIGLLELDFRIAGACELAFFGLVDSAVGQGAGRWMMNLALEQAWSGPGRAAPVARVWVHTCTFDHPGAIAFYQRSGFRVFKVGIELADDPRVTGHLPRDAAPHVPILDPRD